MFSPLQALALLREAHHPASLAALPSALRAAAVALSRGRCYQAQGAAAEAFDDCAGPSGRGSGGAVRSCSSSTSSCSGTSPNSGACSSSGQAAWPSAAQLQHWRGASTSSAAAATAAPSTAARGGRASTARRSSGGGGGSGATSPPPPPPWGHTPDDDLPVEFSLRPSVLSPLHPLYREHQALRQRTEFVETCIVAQEKLSEEIGAMRDDEVGPSLASRRGKLAELTNEVAAAARAGPLPPPGALGEAQGYMMVLEQQLADRHGDFIEFQRVLNGERDVWDYWFNEFAPQYEGLPGLAPLDVAFNRPSSLEEAQKLRRRAMRTFISDAPPERRQPRIDAMGRARATGKRKTAVAQVFVWEGSGRVLVNRKPLDTYFPDVLQRAALLKPLMATNALMRFNVAVKVSGSGRSGQAQAAAHGIARALQNFDPDTYRATLKRAGMLKRDPRMVERKKPGRAKARKSFTWVKR